MHRISCWCAQKSKTNARKRLYYLKLLRLQYNDRTITVQCMRYGGRSTCYTTDGERGVRRTWYALYDGRRTVTIIGKTN